MLNINQTTLINNINQKNLENEEKSYKIELYWKIGRQCFFSSFKQMFSKYRKGGWMKGEEIEENGTWWGE